MKIRLSAGDKEEWQPMATQDERDRVLLFERNDQESVEKQRQFTRDELVEQIRGLDDAGLDQIMILPNFDTRFDVLERVASDILPHV